MDKLWAPWRMEYIKKIDDGACIFCRAASEDRDEENLVLYRGRSTFIIMNRYPYNSGHVMVAPYRHVMEPRELTDDEVLEIHELVVASMTALKTAMNPQGFNIGVNIGKPAGAGFEHLHYHIVPRWSGDTNFMPVLADVKMIPEHLEGTYRKLKPIIEGIARG